MNMSKEACLLQEFCSPVLLLAKPYTWLWAATFMFLRTQPCTLPVFNMRLRLQNIYNKCLDLPGWSLLRKSVFKMFVLHPGDLAIDVVRTAFTSLARGEMQLGPFEPGDHLALRVSCHSPAMQGFPSSRAAPVEIECPLFPSSTGNLFPEICDQKKFSQQIFPEKSLWQNLTETSPMMMMSENFRKIFSLAKRAENTCRPTANQLPGKMWRTLYFCLSIVRWWISYKIHSKLVRAHPTGKNKTVDPLLCEYPWCLICAPGCSDAFKTRTHDIWISARLFISLDLGWVTWPRSKAWRSELFRPWYAFELCMTCGLTDFASNNLAGSCHGINVWAIPPTAVFKITCTNRGWPSPMGLHGQTRSAQSISPPLL